MTRWVCFAVVKEKNRIAPCNFLSEMHKKFRLRTCSTLHTVSWSTLLENQAYVSDQCQFQLQERCVCRSIIRRTWRTIMAIRQINFWTDAHTTKTKNFSLMDCAAHWVGWYMTGMLTYQPYKVILSLKRAIENVFPNFIDNFWTLRINYWISV